MARPSTRVRPVYATAREALRPGLPLSANTGLIYDRYADIWSGSPRWSPELRTAGKSARQAFLEEITRQAENAGGSAAPLLRALHARRSALWQGHRVRFPGSVWQEDFELTSPFVSGIGMTHALDVGFVWDRNLGVPYLPGSSLKGAARAWALHWETVDPGDVSRVSRVFGDQETTGVGAVSFHALYPIVPCKLRVDVLSPHYGKYYGEGAVPGDWMDPTPVFFLTVPAGTVFRTAILRRPEASPSDLQHAVLSLVRALGALGIGAKTAVGYGIFKSRPKQPPSGNTKEKAHGAGR